MIYSQARAVSVFPGTVDSLPSLLKFKHVLVLDLQGCTGLHDHHLAHLGRLVALRYLSLCETWIHGLPKEIGELHYLQTLDIRGTKIWKLPSSVVRLARLVNLLCDYRVMLPDGFGNMQSLQRLEHIKVSMQSPSFAEDLRQLKNLQMLRIDISEFTEELASCLCTHGMGNLNALIMSTNAASMNFVMEPWSPNPLSLKLLEIWDILVPRVPRWISSLGNLQNLTLFVEKVGPVDISLLGRLNALSYLCLRVKIEVADRSSSCQERQRVKVRRTHGFPSLRKLRVGSVNCGFGLLFEVGAMPKLQELHLRFSTDKTRSVTNEEFDFGIQHLPSLATVTCFIGYSMRTCRKVLVWDALGRAVSSNPNYPRLYHEQY